MLLKLRLWAKSSDSESARYVRKLHKMIRNPQFPVIPLMHSALFHTHQLIKTVFSEILRIFYFTPLFKSQVMGSRRNLLLYSGMPQILGALDVEIGDDVRMSGISTFSGRCDPDYRARLIIGNNVDVGWQNAFSVGTKIVLEDDVRLAGRVFLAGFPGHPLNNQARAQGLPDKPEQAGDIIIKQGAWIGTGATILAGVTIGEGAIVAASAVVTKSVEPYTVVAGNPAVAVKKVN